MKAEEIRTHFQSVYHNKLDVEMTAQLSILNENMEKLIAAVSAVKYYPVSPDAEKIAKTPVKPEPKVETKPAEPKAERAVLASR